MAITIGLDFGTHQTKICIENSDSPLHKTYEFYEWEKGVYAFPSIIQINKDHTVRYGSINWESCLRAQKKELVSKPESLTLPPKPIEPNLPLLKEPKLPDPPVYKFTTEQGFSFSISYRELYGIGKTIPKGQVQYEDMKRWKEKCQRLKLEYERRKSRWKLGGGQKFGIPCPQPPIYPPKPIGDEVFEDSNFINSYLIATDQQKQEYQQWRMRCDKLRAKYEHEIKARDEIILTYNRMLSEWENECERLQKIHDDKLRKYEESLVEYPMIFRYFKQAIFSTYTWNYRINPADLSVLYLANIIFLLEVRFGTNFSIQMGVPASESNFKRLQALASGYLIQAIRLVEDVFQNNYEKFLATPFEELLSLIPKYEYTEELKMHYGLIVLPEAYAALRSLTANSRIPEGMSIMLDMGGGTTDISFFVIEDNGEPHIYHFESIAKGLNFFLEYEDRHNFKMLDFSKKKELEDISAHVFSKAFKEFKGNIDTVIKNLTNFLHKDTISRGFMKSAFRDAVQNRPAIYTGGGCYDKRMRIPVYEFSDVKYIDKRILSIPNVVDERKVTIPYSLMATAFGLSIQRLDDEIHVSKKEDLFAKYSYVNDQENRWNAHREHGMYED